MHPSNYLIVSLLAASASFAFADPVEQLTDTLSKFKMEASWPWSSNGDHLYLATTSGLLIADDIQTHTLYTRMNLFPTVTDEQHLYLTNSQGELWQSPIQSPGSINWQRTFQDWVFPPAINNDRLYITTRFNGLQAIDAKTGKTLWATSIDQEPVYKPVLLPDRHIGVLTYSSKLMIYSENGILTDEVELPAIGKYLVVSKAKNDSKISKFYITGIDGSVMHINWPGRKIEKQRVANRVLTPVHSDDQFWWLLEDKSQLWQLNLETGTLNKQKINPQNVEHIYRDNKNWLSIIKKNGTFSQQSLSIKPAT